MSRMGAVTTVAIPTRNAGPGFARTLQAVREQRVDGELELLICDSLSTDGTAALARAYGARVIEIAPGDFSHGATRNRLVAEARGAHVALLTQDAVPAASDWLASLLGGFAAAPDVGLVFGPYRPAPDASPSVARELTDWFASFPAGEPRIDVLAPGRRGRPAREFLGQLGFFTDANGCVSRAAWERVPFRDVAYAEDHLLAQDMLRAGYAKVYVPGAAVVHSHDYSPWGWLRRSFDEARAMREVYGVAPGSEPRAAARILARHVALDGRWRRTHGAADGPAAVARSVAHHGARAAGTVLGARARALPEWLTAQLSLEGRR